METTPSLGHLVRFGPFEVDLRTGELRKHGIRLALQEQPLRILAALLEQPGEVVRRDDLCRRLWPDGTFVDFEHSLNAAVRRLRVRLGDDADTPRFIETVHRRGYRFLVCGQSLPAVPPPAPASFGGGRPSTRARLAVRPFVSFSDERRHDLFSDGLTEETVTQLARGCPPQVGVIARRGRVIGAEYLVEGSVRRDRDRVRIVAQLIESRDDTHLWAGTYDRIIDKGGDALTLQAEVAEQIAKAVADTLSALLPALSRVAAS